MTEERLSATDAALRERITELSVHIPCGGLRGPVRLIRALGCRALDHQPVAAVGFHRYSFPLSSPDFARRTE